MSDTFQHPDRLTVKVTTEALSKELLSSLDAVLDALAADTKFSKQALEKSKSRKTRKDVSPQTGVSFTSRLGTGD